MPAETGMHGGSRPTSEANDVAGRRCRQAARGAGARPAARRLARGDAVARRHQDYHRGAFGYARDNVRFLHGYLERLDELDLAANSFDVIVSNCVVNLSPDKDAVLRGVHRLLRPGGEFYFSDVYADRRVPAEVRNDPVLYGECLGGALYWNDFLRLAGRCGFTDARLVADRRLEITDPALAARVGNIRFHSATYRLFKLDGLDTACEDYGQAVVYRGTIPDHPDRFGLDKHHDIATGRVFPVCGNTWRMLHASRFREHFDFIGSFDRHYGLFEGCGIRRAVLRVDLQRGTQRKRRDEAIDR